MATSPSSDAIVIGEEWISEHYFTTDATKESFKARVLARRKEWDALKDERSTPRARFTLTRAALLSAFSTLSVDDDGATGIRELNRSLRDLLGFHSVGFTHESHGPVTFVGQAGLSDVRSLAIIDARPAESVDDLLAKEADNLVEPFLLDEKTQVKSAARLLSTLFVNDDYKPAFALVLAGPHLLVAERERWPEGRYLAIDLQLICERNDSKAGGEIDRALTCLSAESLAPNAEGDTWWTATLEESVKHTVGVSKDLREGVRLSIEIIANEVVRRRAARGLEPLPAGEAQPLAKQSLRFLYRILFLLYAEASPELGVLPVGAPEYDLGYSVDRMRELTLVDLPTQRSRAGTHLYDSLAVLFKLVNEGHPKTAEAPRGSTNDGLTFRSLRADLFKPKAIAHIDEVALGNAALQEVLKYLLLSKESKGRDRGFISYAELGINQLGAVYEGLMSYTGFFADADLYEVAKDGNSEKGSWVVPTTQADGIADKDFVTTTDPVTGETKPVLHKHGTFVFRLAGRERQQSASYYTPEVLTRFLVSQALEELLDQDDTVTTADEILGLTICEPALGSGAFAIEAVRQLADEYLKRRQRELDQTIDPDAYPRELQKVKAYIALHQVYGVDLNATAVELAEISLWLDTMVDGLDAPWFGLHLRRGNSLIGARKAVFTRAQVEDKSWLKAVPVGVVANPSPGDSVDTIAGRIPHFLLPADGWGAAADAKDAKSLVPEAVTALRDWRKSMWAKPAKKQVSALVELGQRVQRLWEIAQTRLEIANKQIRRDIPIWGRESCGEADSDRRTVLSEGIVTREEIEESLADADGAYRRLRRIMDAWCALWFWPLTEDHVKPPTLAEWYDALHLMLGKNTVKASIAKRGEDTLDSVVTWDDLAVAEYNDRVFSGASRISSVLEKHPWLKVCERVADQQGFFHWQLDFAPIFVRGGFDLQVGNPPWVRPDFDERAALAEYDVRWALNDTQAIDMDARSITLKVMDASRFYVEEASRQVATRAAVSSVAMFPHLSGLRPDLYRCFMELTWSHQSERGVVGLIHLESHFTDESAGPLRRACYRRLRRHWQFINELRLFEIQHQRRYGVNIYGSASGSARFLMASSLYHPETVVKSFIHDGSGPEPGIKDEGGNWDLRPHASRIFVVDDETLRSWHAVIEEGDSQAWPMTRMVYAVNRSANQVLRGMGEAAQRFGDLGLSYGLGWDETVEARSGCLGTEWGRPERWADVVLQGSHISVGNPFNKYPNATLRNHQDWSPVDLENLGADEVPVTKYKPRGSVAEYNHNFPGWALQGVPVSSRDYFRVAWRSMAAPTGERTLVPAIIPAGTAFVTQSIYTFGAPERDQGLLIELGAQLSSLLSDYLVRAVPKSSVPRSIIWQVPYAQDPFLSPEIRLRFARLNCVTSAYAPLWESTYLPSYRDSEWASVLPHLSSRPLAIANPNWSPEVALRRDVDRRQALLEIDVLVALMRGVSIDQLCSIYRTQFPVLVSKDKGLDKEKYIFDSDGRLVPNSVLTVWRKKGDAMSVEDRTATNLSGNTYIYRLPFGTLDRESDMRTAFAHFEKMRLLQRVGE